MTRVGKRMLAVLRYIRDNPGVSGYVVARATGRNGEQGRQALIACRQEGLIVNYSEDGRMATYVITAAGREHLGRAK